MRRRRKPHEDHGEVQRTHDELRVVEGIERRRHCVEPLLSRQGMLFCTLRFAQVPERKRLRTPSRREGCL